MSQLPVLAGVTDCLYLLDSFALLTCHRTVEYRKNIKGQFLFEFIFEFNLVSICNLMHKVRHTYLVSKPKTDVTTHAFELQLYRTAGFAPSHDRSLRII